jgi:DNA-binding response OmpR family regulator
MSQGQRVLVADDEPNIADTLARILQTRGYEAAAVHSGEEAVALASTFLPDVAILDVMLGGLNGIDAASMILQQRPSCRIVLFSGHPETAKLVESGETPFEIFAKPLAPDRLLQHLATFQMSAPPPEPRTSPE